MYPTDYTIIYIFLLSLSNVLIIKINTMEHFMLWDITPDNDIYHCQLKHNDEYLCHVVVCSREIITEMTAIKSPHLHIK